MTFSASVCNHEKGNRITRIRSLICQKLTEPLPVSKPVNQNCRVLFIYFPRAHPRNPLYETFWVRCETYKVSYILCGTIFRSTEPKKVSYTGFRGCAWGKILFRFRSYFF
jgi:hypothetical protein